MATLEEQVQKLIDANVPEQEIGAFIQKHSIEQPQTQPQIPRQQSGAMQTMQSLADPTAVAENIGALGTAGYGVPISGIGGAMAGLGVKPDASLDIPGEPSAGGEITYDLGKANKARMVLQGLLVYDPQTKGGQQLQQASMYPLQKLKQGGRYVGGKLEQKGYPMAGAAAETLIEGSPYILVGGRYLVKKTMPTIEAIDTKISTVINKGIEKAIRPSVSGKKTPLRYKSYLEKTQTAVESVIENKYNIELTDASGRVVIGKTPTTLKETAQAVTQTLQSKFNEYNSLVEKTTGEGIVVELEPIAKKLDKIATDKIVLAANPEVAKFATEFAERLRADNVYTAAEAQRMIATLNDKLKPFYKKSTYENASRATVDEHVASSLREALDSVVENTTGEQYQKLKNDYGALKTLEADLTHRLIVDARKSPSGFFDISDVFSGYHAFRGAIDLVQKGSGAGLSASLFAKGVSQYRKVMADPNRIIGKMFSEADRLVNQKNQLIPKGMQDVPDPFGTRSLVDGMMIEFFPEYSKTRMERGQLKAMQWREQQPGAEPIPVGAGKHGIPLTKPMEGRTRSVIPRSLRTDIGGEIPQSFTEITGKAKGTTKRINLQKASEKINNFRKSKGLRPLSRSIIIKYLEQIV